VLERLRWQGAAVTINPKADAIAKIGKLAGVNGEKAQATVRALDPVALPIFLELGSMIFFSAAFVRRKQAKQDRQELRNSFSFQPETLETSTESVAPETGRKKAFSKDQALRAFNAMRSSGSQKSSQIGKECRNPQCPKWLARWQSNGAINRPAPRQDQQDRSRPSFAKS
jgi:hypothetical protein